MKIYDRALLRAYLWTVKRDHIPSCLTYRVAKIGHGHAHSRLVRVYMQWLDRRGKLHVFEDTGTPKQLARDIKCTAVVTMRRTADVP